MIQGYYESCFNELDEPIKNKIELTQGVHKKILRQRLVFKKSKRKNNSPTKKRK